MLDPDFFADLRRFGLWATTLAARLERSSPRPPAPLRCAPGRRASDIGLISLARLLLIAEAMAPPRHDARRQRGALLASAWPLAASALPLPCLLLKLHGLRMHHLAKVCAEMQQAI